MRRGRSLVAGLALALQTACMSLDTQLNPGYQGPQVYSGVRKDLEMFGPVPMEFDLAWPVVKESGDDTRVFSFFIGLPFF